MKRGKLLKFYSPSCMPCKLLTNFLKEEHIEHESIDITDEASNQLVKQYNIRTIPVIVKVDGIGNEKERLVGFPGTHIVKEFCNEV